MFNRKKRETEEERTRRFNNTVDEKRDEEFLIDIEFTDGEKKGLKVSRLKRDTAFVTFIMDEVLHVYPMHAIKSLVFSRWAEDWDSWEYRY